MTFGIIVPVFRGASVLHRSLRSLAQQVHRQDLHVVIAVNDGLPSTAAAAKDMASDLLRRNGTRCDVLLTESGRANAFNAAERLLAPGPRLYLDQDASLSDHAVDRLAEVLAPGSGVHFAAPVLRRSRGRRPSTVDRYYDVWEAAPYVARSPVTMGAYAVSRSGRASWGLFPALHSDDKFVRLHVHPDERRAVSDCHYEVVLPQDLRQLVRARRRYQTGNRELAARLTGVALPSDLPRHEGLAAAWLRTPSRWPSVALLFAVQACAALPRTSGRKPA